MIEKEIRELEILIKGMQEIDVISPTLVLLAKNKVNDILEEFDQIVALQKTNAAPLSRSKQDEPFASNVAAQSFQTEKKELSHEQSVIMSEPESEHDLPHTSSTSPSEDPITTMEKREKESLAEMLNKDKPSLNELIAQQSDASLAETYSSTKVDDLRQAFTLADRFRFQRELFQGNGEKFNMTLSHLNNLQGAEDAMKYIQSFGWDENNQHAKDFIRLVMRKFNA